MQEFRTSFTIPERHAIKQKFEGRLEDLIQHHAAKTLLKDLFALGYIHIEQISVAPSVHKPWEERVIEFRLSLLTEKPY